MKKPGPGEKAPLFEGKDENGNTIRLKDFKGRKLILYFYPKDDTPGCTAESCSFRDNYDELKKSGFELLGVSADDEKSHRKFISKYQLPFSLIADIDHKICELYGVWGEKILFGNEYLGIIRTTFIISEKGIITHVIDKVDNPNATRQILELVSQ